MKKLIFLFLAIAFVIFLWKATPSNALKKGEMAPDFAIRDLAGNIVKLSDYQGKLVFLNFWSVDCGPCREEMPSMQELNRQLDPKNFQMIAVNIDRDPKRVEKFLQTTGYGFMVLNDDSYGVSDSYSVHKYPETYIIDTQGQILDRFIGAHNWTAPRKTRYFTSLLNNLNK